MKTENSQHKFTFTKRILRKKCYAKKQKLSHKNSTHIFDATEYRSQCVQRRTVGYPEPYYVGDEDCLFTNVLVPETSSSESHLRTFKNLRPIFCQ